MLQERLADRRALSRFAWPRFSHTLLRSDSAFCILGLSIEFGAGKIALERLRHKIAVAIKNGVQRNSGKDFI